MMGKSHMVFGAGFYLATSHIIENLDKNNWLIQYFSDHPGHYPAMESVINSFHQALSLGIGESSIVHWLFLVPVAIFASLVPDIDKFDSKIKSNLLIKIVTLPLIILGHRTWSHSLLAIAGLLILFQFIPAGYATLHLVWFAFVIGYFSHIVGDWMTPSGVPLLFPYMTTFRCPINFRTGSVFEYATALLPLGVYGVLMTGINLGGF